MRQRRDRGGLNASHGCQGEARVRNAAAAKRAPWSDRQRAISGARGAQLLHAPRAVGAQWSQRCVVLWAARGCSARRQRKRGHRAAAAPRRVPSHPGASHDAACGRGRRRRARGGCNGGSARRSGKRRRTQKALAVAWRRRALRLDEDVQAQQHRLETLRRRGGVVLRRRAAREARAARQRSLQRAVRAGAARTHRNHQQRLQPRQQRLALDVTGRHRSAGRRCPTQRDPTQARERGARTVMPRGARINAPLLPACVYHPQRLSGCSFIAGVAAWGAGAARAPMRRSARGR